MPIFMGMMVIGMFISGYIKDTFSLLSVFMTSGVFVVIGALLLLPIVKEKERETWI